MLCDCVIDRTWLVRRVAEENQLEPDESVSGQTEGAALYAGSCRLRAQGTAFSVTKASHQAPTFDSWVIHRGSPLSSHLMSILNLTPLLNPLSACPHYCNLIFRFETHNAKLLSLCSLPVKLAKTQSQKRTVIQADWAPV